MAQILVKDLTQHFPEFRNIPLETLGYVDTDFDHKKQLIKRLKNKNRHYGLVLYKKLSKKIGKNIYQKLSKWS